METKLNLQMFAEGGEGGGAAAGTAGNAPQNAQAGNAKNPLANVVYGKQSTGDDQGAAVQTETKVTASTAEDRKAAFENLINGEYKAEFGDRVQQLINKRFKESKQQEEKLTALQPVLDALGSKYGVDVSDLDKLKTAIEEDDSFYQEAADKEGVTVEQLKRMRQLERENAEFRAAREQQQRHEQAANVYAKWEQEGQTVKQLYGDFDLRTECQHPETGRDFVRLLQNGIDVRTAYEVIHKDELLSGAISYAVQSTQKRTMDNIRAKGMRPQENGAGGSIATQIVKNDPSKWTKADRAEVARRVMRGERVEL